MNALARHSRVPDAAARPFGTKMRARDHLYRAATAHVINQIRGMREGPEVIARQLFGDDDPVTPLVLKAATVPASIATATWAGAFAGQAVADAVVGLAPASAAAQVIARGLTVSLEGYGSITIPYRIVSAADAGFFVSEGSPLPVRQLTIGAGPSLTPSKFGVIVPF